MNLEQGCTCISQAACTFKQRGVHAFQGLTITAVKACFVHAHRQVLVAAGKAPYLAMKAIS